MKVLEGVHPRPLSEILALLQRIADEASNSADILESIDADHKEDYRDSIDEFVEMLADIAIVSKMLDPSYKTDYFARISDEAYYKFLIGDESRLDDYFGRLIDPLIYG